jgi:hypothetical protein|tara:strand:+ start:515 stop:1405 length:891 start_codon:yes stop_codon:yes gene_type:complete
MRFAFTRISLLKFFILNKKRTKRTLLVINFSIFLTVFAATSALISVGVENKISDKELELLEAQRIQNGLHRYRALFPMVHKSMDTIKLFNRGVSRFNLFIDGTKFGDKIFTDREFYFYRYHALITTVYDIFEFKEKDIEEYKSFGSIYYENEEFQKFIIEVFDKWHPYKKKFEEIKKNTNEFEKYEVLTKYDLLRESGSLEVPEDSKNYEDLYNFAWEVHEWGLTFFEAMEMMVLDLEAINETEMKELHKEISSLSEDESQLILFAFLLQLIIFIIIQFFEISSVFRDAHTKGTKK